MPADTLHCRYANVLQLERGHASSVREWLDATERRDLFRWRCELRRRASWCGRLLAKRMILELFPDLVRRPTAIQIRSGQADGLGGRPLIYLHGCRQPWSLSISHTDRGVLVGLCTAADTSLGVDLVQPERVKRGFLKLWFTPAEQRWLARAGSQQATLLWGAKEACYKACNQGESFVPQKIKIQSAGSGILACTYPGAGAAEPLPAQVWEVDGHIAVRTVVRACRPAGRDFQHVTVRHDTGPPENKLDIHLWSKGGLPPLLQRVMITTVANPNALCFS